MAQLLPEDLKEKMRELEKLLQENVDKDKRQTVYYNCVCSSNELYAR
jgi:hypothetical protein